MPYLDKGIVSNLAMLASRFFVAISTGCTAALMSPRKDGCYIGSNDYLLTPGSLAHREAASPRQGAAPIGPYAALLRRL